MDIIISSNTSKPIYEQITSQFKAMIMSGELCIRAEPGFGITEVSFSLPYGAIMGFVGENGAGKTTTMGCTQIIRRILLSLAQFPDVGNGAFAL